MTRSAILLLIAVSALSGGCAALSNPVADAIPVRRVPEEILGRPRADLVSTPLNLLRQTEPEAYRLDRGDVLAVVAEDVLGVGGQPAPVQLPSITSDNASVGYPIPVGADGTISLPRLPPIPVKDKTLQEAEQLIRDYATGKLGGVQLIRPGAERVSVQLLQKRTYEIIVVREDGSSPVTIGSGGGQGGAIIGTDQQGTGTTLRLQAYENDVLRALNATGGVPGNRADDELLVVRGKYDPADPYKNASRIPLRVYPDQPVQIKDEDIILKTGDILYVGSRETDSYYTAGLIGGGQFLLPRDADLRVIEAIARVRGPLINGGFSANSFVATSTNTGLGNPSPSLVTVMRKLPGNRTIPIRVDLDRAFRDPRENILVRPGDILVLQEKPGQSIIRYMSQQFRITTVADTIKAPGLNQVITGNNP